MRHQPEGENTVLVKSDLNPKNADVCPPHSADVCRPLVASFVAALALSLAAPMALGLLQEDWFEMTLDGGCAAFAAVTPGACDLDIVDRRSTNRRSLHWCLSCPI
jgi:hypothetical protein